jgi:hypothetical protein
MMILMTVQWPPCIKNACNASCYKCVSSVLNYRIITTYFIELESTTKIYLCDQKESFRKSRIFEMKEVDLLTYLEWLQQRQPRHSQSIRHPCSPHRRQSSKKSKQRAINQSMQIIIICEI